MKFSFILPAVLFFILSGCSSADKEWRNQDAMQEATRDAIEESKENEKISADGEITSEAASETGASVISSSAAVVDLNDSSGRKFIRTADLKFKVKDVRISTLQIEDIAAGFGGYVSFTNLKSSVIRTTVVPVSNDSSLETIYFRMANDITLRIPDKKLDSALRTLGSLVEFLDYRLIRAEDVRFQILANSLAKKRLQKHGDRLSANIVNKGKKLNDITNAEESLLRKNELADATNVANLEMQDKIEMSTINLQIYQRESALNELIENEKNIDSFEPGFGKQFADALVFGWKIIKTFILFLAKIWGILLIIAVVVFVVRKIFPNIFN